MSLHNTEVRDTRISHITGSVQRDQHGQPRATSAVNLFRVKQDHKHVAEVSVPVRCVICVSRYKMEVYTPFDARRSADVVRFEARLTTLRRGKHMCAHRLFYRVYCVTVAVHAQRVL